MAFTLSGFGTAYHGTRWLPDGTYITTRWFVFLFVPIVPLGSVRVLEASHISGSAILSGQSLKVQKIPLDKEMVLRAYAWVLGAFLAICLFVVGVAFLGMHE